MYFLIITGFVLHIVSGKLYVPNENRCVNIASSVCASVDPIYNKTQFPNFQANSNEDVALREFYQFLPLLKTKCSSYLPHFLCSIYFPVCSPALNALIPPCRSLCEKSQVQCQSALKTFGVTFWPFNCNRYPRNAKGVLCIGPDGKKDKKRKRVWQVIDENEKRHIGCEANTEILIRRVKHKDSKCCQKATKEVLSAVCNGKPVCIIKNSANFLGAHCAKGQGKLMIKFKCVKTGTYKSKCEQKPSV